MRFQRKARTTDGEDFGLPSASKTIVFRLDFDDKIGLGHLSRCSYLATALQSLGYRTVLLLGPSANGSQGVAAHFLEAFSSHQMLSGPDSCVQSAESTFLERISGCHPDLIVLDHYGASPDFVAAIRQFAPVLLIEDGDRGLDADYILAYGSPGASFTPNNQIPAGRLVGSKFTLVKGSSDFRIEDLSSDRAEVTVSLGGGISDGQGIPVARAVIAKIGEGYGYLTGRDLSSSGLGFIGPKETFRDRSGFKLSALLSESRRAIVSGGVSLMEAVAHGIPSVAFVTARNQLEGLKRFQDSHDVLVADSLEFFSSQEFQTWWSRYEEPSVRKRAELFLMSTVDSFGPLRVALAVGLCDSTKISLRRASEADLPILLGWRQELDASSVQSGAGETQAAEHLEWFTRMEREGAQIWISEISGLPVGQVRIHRDQQSQRDVLSYSVDQLFRGRGFGTSMLNQVLNRSESPNEVWAKVHTSNIPSLKTLSTCGFRVMHQDSEGFIWMIWTPESSGILEEENRV